MMLIGLLCTAETSNTGEPLQELVISMLVITLLSLNPGLDHVTTYPPGREMSSRIIATSMSVSLVCTLRS